MKLFRRNPYVRVLGLASLVVVQQAAVGCIRKNSTSVKGSDYKAPGGLQYTVTGQDFVVLDPAFMAKPHTQEEIRAEAEQMAAYRTIADGIFLEHYVGDKEAEDKNFNYGRFNAELRFANDINPEVTQDLSQPGRFSFKYSFVVGGYADLIDRINADAYQKGKASAPGQFHFAAADLDAATLAMVKSGHEWFREDDWKEWSPTYTQGHAPYDMVATIVRQDAAPDAYLPVDQMLVKDAQGHQHLPIAVHFGWDGEAQGGDIPEGGYRYDVVLAQKLYKKLTTKLGFTAPVADLKDYNAFAPGMAPFTKIISVRGEPVSVDVSVYVAGQLQPMTANGLQAANSGPLVQGPDPETAAGAAAARAAMVDSLQTKKVVLYLGHSGLRTGFNFGDWFVGDDVALAGTLYAADMANMQMMDSYQLLIADGCQTYYLSQNVLSNPLKHDPADPSKFKNMNVITSLGFTDADSIKTVTRLLNLLTKQETVDGQTRTVVPLVSTLLKRYNKDSTVPFRQFMGMSPRTRNEADEDDGDDEDDQMFPMYGLHGIDSNPRGNPLADTVGFGDSCTDVTTCGSGDGNLCVQSQAASSNVLTISSSKSRAALICSMQCVDDSGCPLIQGQASSCVLPATKAIDGKKALGTCMPVVSSNVQSF